MSIKKYSYDVVLTNITLGKEDVIADFNVLYNNENVKLDITAALLVNRIDLSTVNLSDLVDTLSYTVYQINATKNLKKINFSNTNFYKDIEKYYLKQYKNSFSSHLKNIIY